MQIKQILKSKTSLAPMAGITDYVLRSLVRKYSADCLLTTEMISSEFLMQNRPSEITKRDENHSPISYQLSGHKPHMMRKSAEILTPLADIIDINMGCPVKKVVGGQDGCSLMRNPTLAYDLVQAVKDGTDKPVSVKFRLGYTMDELNFVEFGQKMQDAGAEFITIHGRTRSQMYSGKADWKLIKKLKENIDVPVFANGDIVSIDTAIQALEESQADGIAIARGILSDPTLIYRIENYLKNGEKLPEPELPEKIKMLKWILDEEIKFRGEDIGLKFCRKFYAYFLTGFKNASKLRGQLVTENSYPKIIEMLDSITTYAQVP